MSIYSPLPVPFQSHFLSSFSYISSLPCQHFSPKPLKPFSLSCLYIPFLPCSFSKDIFFSISFKFFFPKSLTSFSVPEQNVFSSLPGFSLKPLKSFSSPYPYLFSPPSSLSQSHFLIHSYIPSLPSELLSSCHSHHFLPFGHLVSLLPVPSLSPLLTLCQTDDPGQI